MGRKPVCILAACLVLCLVLTGCAEAGQILREHIFDSAAPAEPTEPPTETVPINTDAVDFLVLLYPNEHQYTAVDYVMLDYFQTDDGSYYKVKWSVDVSEDLVRIIPNANGTVTVDVNEMCSEDVPYVLTASIATAQGYRLTHNWYYTVPKATDMVTIVEKAYFLKNGERLPGMHTLTGKVSSIEKKWSEDYENVTLTIRVTGCEDKPVRCYCLVGRGVEDIAVGDVITVTGSLQNFNDRVEFDMGCKLVSPEPEPTEPPTEELTQAPTEAATGETE